MNDGAVSSIKSVGLFMLILGLVPFTIIGGLKICI